MLAKYEYRDYTEIVQNVFRQLCDRYPQSQDINTLADEVNAYENMTDVANIAEQVLLQLHLKMEITLHSFRRFVKTTISDLGYADFSEWFIGHSGSTYWTKKDSEKAEIFRRIEPYLTFLNIPR